MVDILSKKDFLDICGIHQILPIDAIDDIYHFNKIIKSPYSHSFYNSDKVGWSYKENGILRISNHWNFTTSHTDTIHSITDISIQDKQWYLGQYENGVFKIIKGYSNNFYKNTKKLAEKYPIILEKIQYNRQQSIQIQKDVNDGLIYGEFINKDMKQCVKGTISKLGGKIVVFDNEFQVRTYGDLKTKGVLKIYKNNTLIKSYNI